MIMFAIVYAMCNTSFKINNLQMPHTVVFIRCPRHDANEKLTVTFTNLRYPNLPFPTNNIHTVRIEALCVQYNNRVEELMCILGYA